MKKMEIILPQDFLPITKNKHLLLDTCVFIDAFHHPTVWGDFFNKLKDNDTTMVSIDQVLTEFLRGSQDSTKFREKKEFFEKITETIIPVSGMQDNVEDLIMKYGLESKNLSLTDFYLGSTLMKYGKNIFLMTRDLSDFPTTIFERNSFFNVPHSKGIFTFGIYSYN